MTTISLGARLKAGFVAAGLLAVVVTGGPHLLTLTTGPTRTVRLVSSWEQGDNATMSWTVSDPPTSGHSAISKSQALIPYPPVVLVPARTGAVVTLTTVAGGGYTYCQIKIVGEKRVPKSPPITVTGLDGKASCSRTVTNPPS